MRVPLLGRVVVCSRRSCVGRLEGNRQAGAAHGDRSNAVPARSIDPCIARGCQSKALPHNLLKVIIPLLACCWDDSRPPPSFHRSIDPRAPPLPPKKGGLGRRIEAQILLLLHLDTHDISKRPTWSIGTLIDRGEPVAVASSASKLEKRRRATHAFERRRAKEATDNKYGPAPASVCGGPPCFQFFSALPPHHFSGGLDRVRNAQPAQPRLPRVNRFQPPRSIDRDAHGWDFAESGERASSSWALRSSTRSHPSTQPNNRTSISDRGSPRPLAHYPRHRHRDEAQPVAPPSSNALCADIPLQARIA